MSKKVIKEMPKVFKVSKEVNEEVTTEGGRRCCRKGRAGDNVIRAIFVQMYVSKRNSVHMYTFAYLYFCQCMFCDSPAQYSFTFPFDFG